MFGTGSFGALYRRGPNAELIGRRVDDFSVRGGAGRVVLDRGPLLDAVDPSSGLLPTYIEGEVHGAIGSGRAVAIAVDGTIRAVARSYRQHGKARFAAFVPETALRRGPNAVAVYAVTRASAGVVLSELANGESGRSLVVRGGRETIESPRGAAVQVEPGAISGIVRVGQRGSAFLFTGWARIAKATRPPKSLVVLVDGQEIFGSPTTVVRPLRVLGDFAPKRTLGFSFELPSAALPAPGRGASVRVFALHGRLASELRYAGPYPWPSG